MVALTGQTQTRVAQFLATRQALKLEMSGMRFRGAVMATGKRNGYIPVWVRRKADAVAYMSFVREMLLQRKSELFVVVAEDIITGRLVSAGKPQDCGCYPFKQNAIERTERNRIGLDMGEVICPHMCESKNS